MTSKMRRMAWLALFVLAACGRGPEIRVTDGRVTIPPPGASTSAGYFTLENGADQVAEIRGLSSPAFGAIEMHETRTEGGVSSMHRLESVTVPARGRVAFETGGKHLMMFRPTGALERGSRVPVVFTLVRDGQPTTLETSFVAGEPGEEHGQ
jgi:periplasmic copper chaperone A